MMLLIAITMCYDCWIWLQAVWSSMYVENILICSNKMIGECNIPLLLGCMYSFGYAIIFMMQMMFSMNVVNTKVVANLHILLVLKFYDHRPDSFRFILPSSLLSDFAYALYTFEWLLWLTYLNMESCISDSRRVVVLFIGFPNC
jgi:hypothetical protein